MNFSSFACVLSFPSIGVFSLQISCNQVDFGPSFVDFQAIAYPTLIQCVPSSASVLGGQLVTVVGQNLFNPRNSTIFCEFSSRSIEPAIFSSESSVVCVVPPSSSTATDKSFISLVGFPFSWKNAIAFDYIESNVTRVLTIKPSLVSVGQTMFTLFGLQFAADAFCAFATVTSPVSYDTNGWALCAIDVSSIGHGQIEVISHRRLIASTYISVVALLKLLAIQPSQVHLGWSGSVTISGVNFVSSNELVCSFGETIGYATYISPQAVLCSLDIISRDINFRVSNDGLKFSLETVAIVVASSIEIFRIEPTFVSSHYGTYVTLFGNRIPVDPLCVFQGAIFPSFESNSSICVCLVNPDGLPGNFSLGLFDGASSHSRHFYIVALDSSISAIVPSQVPKSFVSTLRVEGLHALPDLE